jgi:hypothetical protein
MSRELRLACEEQHTGSRTPSCSSRGDELTATTRIATGRHRLLSSLCFELVHEPYLSSACGGASAASRPLAHLVDGMNPSNQRLASVSAENSANDLAPPSSHANQQIPLAAARYFAGFARVTSKFVGEPTRNPRRARALLRGRNPVRGPVHRVHYSMNSEPSNRSSAYSAKLVPIVYFQACGRQRIIDSLFASTRSPPTRK